MQIRTNGLLTMFAAVLLFVGLLILSGCEEDKTISQSGRMAYINLEGGFYGIIGDDGVSYDPVNLPPEFEQDSLRVIFEGKILTGQASIHMWGKLLQISRIERLHP